MRGEESRSEAEMDHVEGDGGAMGGAEAAVFVWRRPGPPMHLSHPWAQPIPLVNGVACPASLFCLERWQLVSFWAMWRRVRL